MLNPNVVYYESKRYNTLREVIRVACEEGGERTAFRYLVGKDEDVRVSYRAFYEDTMALGTALAHLTLDGCHVAIIGESSYRWATSFMTLLQSHGVAVPVDKELPAGDIVTVITDSEAKAVIYGERFESLFYGENGEGAERFPGVQYFIGMDRAEHSVDGRFLSFTRLQEEGRLLYADGDRTFLSRERNPLSMAELVYTSGTTGMAKGVMLSEHNLVSELHYGLQVQHFEGERTLSVLPYHHTYESSVGLLASLALHCEICINDSLRHVLRNLQYFKPTMMLLVPAFLEVFQKKILTTVAQQGKEAAFEKLVAVSRALRKRGIDLRRTLFRSVHKAFGGELKKVIAGGAPLRPELVSFFDDIGILVVNGYGITECAPLISCNIDAYTDSTTVGVPLPCLDVRIDEPDEDGTGEICVRGDSVMMGYYRQPELTAEVITADGWFHTGDYGMFTEKGFLKITGRKKNLIILSNGKNIFPEEIENYVVRVPYVSEVVVYGQKDEAGHDTAICAEVYLSQDELKARGIEDVRAALKKDIAEACAELPSYKRISHIFVRKEPFEKTTTNKIRRNSVLGRDQE